MIGDLSRRYLLQLARESIANQLTGHAPPSNTSDDSVLQQARGVFVSLHQSGRLRGCIGRLDADRALWENVVYMARAAAFEDPRFPSLEPDELGEVRLEISALTPMQLVGDPEEIEVGTHGVMVVNGIRRGVLLPQVASNFGWTREEFLSQVCEKAMLPNDAWRQEETALYVFSAEVFSEDDYAN